jgi:hypothetical protein
LIPENGNFFLARSIKAFFSPNFQIRFFRAEFFADSNRGGTGLTGKSALMKKKYSRTVKKHAQKNCTHSFLKMCVDNF